MPLFSRSRRRATQRPARPTTSTGAATRDDLASNADGDAGVAHDLKPFLDLGTGEGKRAEDETRSNRLALFRERSGLWLVGVDSAAEVTRRAADLLSDGLDTPALRAVAGLSMASDWWEVRDQLGRAWDELGAPLPSDGSDELIVLALRAQCRRFLEGRLDAPALANWAHSVAGHDGPVATHALVQLDDDLDACTFPKARYVSSDLQTITEHLVDRFLAATDDTVRVLTPPAI